MGVRDLPFGDGIKLALYKLDVGGYKLVVLAEISTSNFIAILRIDSKYIEHYLT